MECPSHTQAIMALTGHFIKINSEEFIHAVVLAEADAVVKVAAEWNAASHLMGFVFPDLITRFHQQVRFFQVDIDKDPEMKDTYRVDSLPTLLFFRKGTLVDKLCGLNHKEMITQKIEAFISQSL